MHQSAPFSILSAMLIVGIFAGTTPAVSQQWPQKPLKIVVAFPPGTPGDITGRGINDKLGAALGQPVVIENRPGAGGNIGAEAVGNSAPDGYTLLMGTPGSLTINPNLMAKVTYSLNDFSPITLATISPFVIVVHPSTPANNIINASRRRL